MQIALVFPHQLFEVGRISSFIDSFAVIEDSLFFGDDHVGSKFHVQKLVLHRASMRSYSVFLKDKGYDVYYYDYESYKSLDLIMKQISDDGFLELHIYDVVDYLLRRRLKRFAVKHGLEIVWYESPNFINTKFDCEEYFRDKKRYSFRDFYISQRQKLDLLLDGDKPIGGKWSFDSENRKKLPGDVDLPRLLQFPSNSVAQSYVDEAKSYVSRIAPDAFGDIDGFNYPINHHEARLALRDFIDYRLVFFGPYEDALSVRGDVLFHSQLTPYLNIGLISPEEVVESLMDAYQRGGVKLASVEGFVRQIVGWREYMRAMYEIDGVRQRKANHMNFSRKLNPSFWNGSTGIEPVDSAIQKVYKTGYMHHIERLMVVGSFMFLCEIDPDEVYSWFMEVSIDSYDWVMVPNVYAMSQYADGGRLTTKPYFASSNYIKKMSDFSAGDWEEVLTALYWNAINRNRGLLSSNYRLRVMVSLLDKMDGSKRKKYYKIADDYMANLDSR